MVQIDMDYRTVGKNRDITLGLVGDPGAILAAVAQAASGRIDNGADGREAWLEELRAEEEAAYEKRLPRLLSDASPIHPLRLAHEINEFLTEDTIYIGDGGDVVTFSGGVVQPQGARPLDGPGPARHARRRHAVRDGRQARPARTRRSSACFGDGAFGLTGWDFETLVRFDLPFIGVVGNNSYMNQIRYGQIQKYGEERGDIGNKLGDVRYDEFAKMLGGYGEEVREPEGHPAGARAGARVAASRR